MCSHLKKYSSYAHKNPSYKGTEFAERPRWIPCLWMTWYCTSKDQQRAWYLLYKFGTSPTCLWFNLICYVKMWTMCLISVAIPILKKRRSHYRLTIEMRMPRPGKIAFILKRGLVFFRCYRITQNYDYFIPMNVCTRIVVVCCKQVPPNTNCTFETNE